MYCYIYRKSSLWTIYISSLAPSPNYYNQQIIRTMYAQKYLHVTSIYIHYIYTPQFLYNFI